jgi:hypothetical protein
MEIFRKTFKIVFLVQIILYVVSIIFYFISKSAFAFTGYLITYVMMFFQIPLLLILILVVLFSVLSKRYKLRFFKAEFLYILICVSMLLLLATANYICPACQV